MTALVLLLLCAPAARAAAPAPAAAFAVAVATAPARAAADIKTLTARLLALKRAEDAPVYAAARLVLLEDIALLQEWAERAADMSAAVDVFDRELTPEGRAALGRRKPAAADFTTRKGFKRVYRSDGLDFKKR
ncbi:MAG: hypothetical protein PHS14_03370 [Elusimicrobia bacterium]|nr:hypothetical protein [Elusimicrobiota bacterium]